MNDKIAILINLSANQNNAAIKWGKIKHKLNLEASYAEVIRIEYTVPFDIQTCVSNLALNQNVRFFISAGGDGSINYLMNAISCVPDIELNKFTIGAIGLGSSNDFLKPFNTFIDGIPVKINKNGCYEQDIGIVQYELENERNGKKLFVINASIGLLAKANYNFNKGDWFINFFKKKKLDWAINYTAIKTLLNYNSSKIEISSGNEKKECSLNSLSVLKNPNVSGSFRFNQDIQPNDRSFGIHYCYNQNLIVTIATIIDLAKGCFVSIKPKKGRVSYRDNRLEIKSKDFLFLETDGEVEKARNITFSMHPQTIKVMG